MTCLDLDYRRLVAGLENGNCRVFDFCCGLEERPEFGAIFDKLELSVEKWREFERARMEAVARSRAPHRKLDPVRVLLPCGC